MTLYQFLKESAARLPNKTALIFNGQNWSYAEVLRNTDKMAEGLQKAGIIAGSRIAIFSKNCPEFALTVFACSKIGASAVPVNFFLKADDLSFICLDAEVSGIVTQTAFLPLVDGVHKSTYRFKNIWVTDGESNSFQSLLNADKHTSDAVSDPETTVLILYTSGTTGKPKGVMLSNKNLTTNTQSCVTALDLSSSDRFMCMLPMFHVFAWTTCVLVPLYLGCTIVIVEAIRPPKPWIQLMGKHGVTVFSAVPQIYAVLAEQAKGFKRWALKYYFFRKVRFCISGAAPLQDETLQKFEDRIGTPLLQGYGLTETSPVVSSNTLKKRRKGSVGQPFPGIQVKIIDEKENTLAADAEGEICIQGPNIMQGYHKQEQATREVFTRDGWFKTGDVGLIDRDGYLYIKDRIKDMIIVKGLKVFSIQVEEVLLSHPVVQEAAVVGIPDASGDETVKAFVVLKEGFTLDKAELMKLCHEKLAAYKRPRDIEFRKELPKNALQKVLKRELKKSAGSQWKNTKY